MERLKGQRWLYKDQQYTFIGEIEDADNYKIVFANDYAQRNSYPLGAKKLWFNSSYWTLLGQDKSIEA
jgi:hypothetical protein